MPSLYFPLVANLHTARHERYLIHAGRGLNTSRAGDRGGLNSQSASGHQALHIGGVNVESMVEVLHGTVMGARLEVVHTNCYTTNHIYSSAMRCGTRQKRSKFLTNIAHVFMDHLNLCAFLRGSA